MSRNQRYELQKKAEGFVKVTIWVRAAQKANLATAAAQLAANQDLEISTLRNIRNGKFHRAN